MKTRKIAIAWADLTYRVRPFLWSSKKTTLNNLYGSVEFGTICALMGPSGAGKTTLLNCINGKLSEGLDSNTKIYLNDSQKIVPCFVAQHEKEHMIMCLTAKESLMYASKLKNSDLKSSAGPIDHEINVNNIMDELMISDICDTRVDCCSGGQQKRLTIALEMVKVVKPNLLCIDEPTTGLDSNVAEIVMQCLCKLAKRHRIAVITSIHQPNQEILMMFDNIYVLAKGGNCIYNGQHDQIRAHLAQNNIRVNENQSPIEQLLKLGSIDSEGRTLNLLVESTRQLSQQSVLENCQNETKLSYNGLNRRNKSFKLIDMWYIMMRSMNQLYLKQWKLLLFQFMFYVSYCFLSCKMFKEDIGKPRGCFNPHTIGNDTCLKELENDILLFQNQNFLAYMYPLIMFTNCCISVLVYCNDAKIFYYEHQNAWYSTGSFFWAKNMVEIVPTIINGISCGFVIYYCSGQLLESKRLMGFVLLITFGFLISEAIGHSIGIIFQNYPQLALLTALATMAPMALFSNFFVPLSDVPVPFQYLSEYSFPKHHYNSALILVYGLKRCSADEKSVVLLMYNLKDEMLAQNFYKLAMSFVFTKLLALVILFLKTDNKITIKMCSIRKLKTNKSNELQLHKSQCEVVEENVNMTLADVSLEGVDGNEIDSIPRTNENIMCIAWNDLTLCIPKTLFIQQKVILNQLNGFFEFGTTNALMGPSGAGKTTLLNCINGVNKDYLIENTTILLSRFRQIRTCFITQNQKDHILIGLTARQAVTYASKLKNTEKGFDHKSNVENIMNELLINNTYDTNVEHCSGGEQKRIVIAMELTSGFKPNLLCIDEPTSGLDSNAAEVVIKCLKRLSEKHNICVITSIHQPNSDILVMFDKLYVLSKGGHCVYSGRPQQLSQHLTQCGIQWKRTQIFIEVLLKYSCNELNDKNVKRMVDKTRIIERNLISSRSLEMHVFPDGIRWRSKRFYIRDLWLLLKRGMTYNLRFYWKIILFQFCIYLSFGLLLRTVYNPNIGRPSGCVSFDDEFNTCAKTDQKLLDEKRLSVNLKFNLFIMLVTVFFTMAITALSFAYDTKVFFNEHRNGWYSTGVFYWSKTIVEIIPLIFIIICFSYVVDIYESENSMFVPYVVFLTIGLLQVQGVGHVVGILTGEDTRTGVLAIIGFFVISFMFSNVLIPIKELHYSLRVVSNLATIKLLIESVIVVFYGLDRCSDTEFSYVLFILDIDNNDLYKNLYLLLIQLLIFRVLALIILIVKVNPIEKNKKKFLRRKSIIDEFTMIFNRSTNFYF